MRKLFCFLSFMLIAFSSWAAELKDIQVLEVRYKSEKVILKLRDPSAGQESFFFVHLVSEDRLALQKLSLAIKKFQDKKHQLNLEIVSFSPKPFGSMYMSPNVEFKMPKQDEFILLP
jgi:hypothetical protein